MIDGFNGLWHHPIVGRHHQNGNIRHLGAARPHGGKRFMSRSIQKHNFFALLNHLISADMLGDAACLLGGHMRLANGIQQ